MAIPQEIKDILAASAKGLAQARFLLTAERHAAARELSRAASSAVRNSEDAAALNDKLTALAYQILENNVPESEFDSVVAQLVETIRRASSRARGAGNETLNLMAACVAVDKVIDASVPQTLFAVADQLEQILAQIAPEPEPEPQPDADDK